MNLILAPIESTYMTSYWSSIATSVLSCHILLHFRDIRAFVHQNALFVLYCILFFFLFICNFWFYFLLYNMYVWYVLINDIHTYVHKYFSIPHPYLAISTKILGCSSWSRSMMSMMLGSAKSEHPKLTESEIIFKEFKPMWSRYINVTDGQTDDQMERLAIATPRFV